MSDSWKTPSINREGDSITNMEDNNKFWFKEGAKAADDTWFEAVGEPPATNLLQEELIEVKGICAWGSDGFHHTYCDFKVTHWRPMK